MPSQAMYINLRRVFKNTFAIICPFLSTLVRRGALSFLGGFYPGAFVIVQLCHGGDVFVKNNLMVFVLLT